MELVFYKKLPSISILKQKCEIWGFHSSDYEEWRLLGYKNPVRTSQETHYISTTETSQLMLCKIWGFHGSDYEEWGLHLKMYKLCHKKYGHHKILINFWFGSYNQ
jgi:hypothetical protein